jgi:hypothetical protein
MFKWYAASMICYAYMPDVLSVPEFLRPSPRAKGGTNDMPRSSSQLAGMNSERPSAFSTPRWFSRGWTLQELIAPFKVIFYTESWERIGSKKEFAYQISRVTGIPESILTHSSILNTVSALNRMAWASKRQTTREEDMAYCLLGIFDVNIPLLYGEGSRAF